MYHVNDMIHGYHKTSFSINVVRRSDYFMFQNCCLIKHEREARMEIMFTFICTHKILSAVQLFLNNYRTMKK